MRVLSVSGVETINDTTFKHNVHFYKEKTGILSDKFLFNNNIIKFTKTILRKIL